MGGEATNSTPTNPRPEYVADAARPELLRWQNASGWRAGTVPGAVLESALGRQMEPVKRLVEVLPRFGCSGLLLHVSWHVPGLLYLPEDHKAAWSDARKLVGGLPGVVGLALSPDAQLHTHATLPVEVFPRVAAYFAERLEDGEDPRRLELSGERLRELVEPEDWRPSLFVRLVYDLRGHVRYTRCQPRIEAAKVSGHSRQLSPVDVLEAADFYLVMREANGGRNPAASKCLNIPRRTAAELAARAAALEERRERRREAERREAKARRQRRRRILRREVEKRQKREAQKRREAVERGRAALRGIRRGRAAPPGVRRRSRRRWHVPGQTVRRVAACRLLEVGHARPPPRRRPRVW